MSESAERELVEVATQSDIRELAPAPSLEPYNALRANLTEAAKHSRNLFMTHLAVQSYALIVLAGLSDLSFFQPGNQLALPIINASVAVSWFVPALALLSLLVFVYWQMYQRKMWLLANEVEAMAERCSGHPEFVPAHGNFRYPWIAFFRGDTDRVLRLGVLAFGFFQWVPMPLVQLVCWTRTARLGGGPEHWITLGLPYAPFFATLCLASVALVCSLWELQRRLSRPGARWWPGACIALLCAPLLFAAVSFSRAHGLQLPGLRGSNRAFDGLDMAGANLVSANLPFASFRAASLQRAQLDRALFTQADFTDATLQGAHMQNADLTKATLRGVDLQGANLKEAWLVLTRLDGANLQHAGLQHADLSSAELSAAKLQHVSLAGARLFMAKLDRVNLRDGDLSGADLHETDLQGADLRGADLRGVQAHYAHLRGAVYDDTTRLDEDFDPKAHGMQRLEATH
jgi:uncharacterized protein YjbI with pentapeptide repeats